MYTYKWIDCVEGWGIFENGERVFRDTHIRDREDLLIFLESLAPKILIIQLQND